MIPKNKLNLTNPIELAQQEEKLTKKRAVALWGDPQLATYAAGSVQRLTAIHHYLFQDIYDFAGELRTINIVKGHFRFAPVIYLSQALQAIEQMPQATFDEIVEKYVEMNVAHPFREGNGRSMCIWLDDILKQELGYIINWTKIDKTDYLLAMERSPIKDLELKHLLKEALTDEMNNRELYLKGIDSSYDYEGLNQYKASEL
ncbi:cell filamentation protein [Granulicatella balaenopterae]|uniref:protein adenylyltransferase n=1 Tax=Granulicatella balaenopterae TaxID=137733 RepID=A0A1H9K4H6_9LACT|nr:Fic family protein [Granulicatella balaenopterae]SEQ93735.1 cell filamentation protein [Granulicatella balaenopterae]